MKKLVFFVLSCILVSGSFAAEPKIDAEGAVKWERFEIEADLSLDLASAEIRLPTGRVQGEETLDTEFPRLLRPTVLSIPVDSSNTLGDLVNRGDFSFQDLGALILSASRRPSSLSTDLSAMSIRYSIKLLPVIKNLVRHRQSAEAPRTLIPLPSASYTGILIIADTPLPVHGRQTSTQAVPCLFPKVWDSEMNVIYERNMVDPAEAQRRGIVRYASAADIFRATPSGLSPELEELVGRAPLRILARGVFGSNPTDLIIDRDDALIIISSAENRNLLKEGRLAFILDEKILTGPLQ